MKKWDLKGVWYEIFAGVNESGNKLFTGVNYTGDKLPPVLFLLATKSFAGINDAGDHTLSCIVINSMTPVL